MTKLDLTNKRIVISRTDSIGDVMLTLPLCAWIKENFPAATVIFLGNSYTKPVLKCYSAVDEIVDWKEIENLPSTQRVEFLRELNIDVFIHVFPKKEIAALAKKAKIPVRIGTSHRTFHLLTCSHRVSFTRKKSDLHESQLNFELLRPLGLTTIPSIEAIQEFTKYFQAPKAELPTAISNKLNSSRNTVILHPKSQGSAVEWGISNYNQLAIELEKTGHTVFFTGTEKEGEQFRSQINFNENIIDTSGQLSLEQLITFISKCQTLVACSTGPLHIAGFLNLKAIGLFSPRKPIHQGRWKALGKNVKIIVNDENCPTCKKGKSCKCIEDISVEKVLNSIQHLKSPKSLENESLIDV